MDSDPTALDPRAPTLFMLRSLPAHGSVYKVELRNLPQQFGRPGSRFRQRTVSNLLSALIMQYGPALDGIAGFPSMECLHDSHARLFLMFKPNLQRFGTTAPDMAWQQFLSDLHQRKQYALFKDGTVGLSTAQYQHHLHASQHYRQQQRQQRQQQRQQTWQAFMAQPIQLDEVQPEPEDPLPPLARQRMARHTQQRRGLLRGFLGTRQPTTQPASAAQTTEAGPMDRQTPITPMPQHPPLSQSQSELQPPSHIQPPLQHQQGPLSQGDSTAQGPPAVQRTHDQQQQQQQQQQESPQNTIQQEPSPGLWQPPPLPALPPQGQKRGCASQSSKSSPAPHLRMTDYAAHGREKRQSRCATFLQACRSRGYAVRY